MQKQYSAKIKEIFSSIQGEGLYVGEKHIFVRFCFCNLKCGYCDTDFSPKGAQSYSIDDLYQKLSLYDAKTISFTGGEPLLEVDFLSEFLHTYKTVLNKKIYLETNGTMPRELRKIIEFCDVVAADIKLRSVTGEENRFFRNEEFLRIASEKEAFAKVVFDKNILDEEIENCVKLVNKFNIPLVIQPVMPMDKDIKLDEIFDKFYSKYNNIRLIPQTHKFLNLE